MSDKLKSEEEIAREEKEKLEKLERERRERMFGEPEVKEKIKHRSADDLDDGWVSLGKKGFPVWLYIKFFSGLLLTIMKHCQRMKRMVR